MHRIFLTTLLACAAAHAAELTGIVVDPTGHPVPGAQVAAFHARGIITTQITGDQGQFDIYISPLYEGVQLRVTAAGFATATVGMGASRIQLALAPQRDSVRVAASAMDVPASEQGSSVTLISAREIRERNEAQAVDLLRQVPGVSVAQSGPRGTVTSLFIRGGESKYNLVLLNGIPINSFYYGGLFDFAHVPSDFIEEIHVSRGPQSAIYGSYAIAGVVDFQTRSPENGTAFDFLAEGGTHAENRFSLSGSGMAWKNFGLAGSLSSLHANGPVPNSDYRNDNVFLALTHRWHTQNLFAFGDFDSNETGEVGPFGSNPLGYYSGFDLISREKNNTSLYGAHYQNDLFDALRLDVMTGFSLNNSPYISPYGFSFNKDIRATAEIRGTWTVASRWTMAAGYAFDREELKNTYVTDSSSRSFPLRRDNSGVYWENHLVLGHLFLNAGLREEIFQTPFIPGNVYGYPPRPDFQPRTDTRLNPKVSAAYLLRSGQRIHASWGTGIRPPGGTDLAFTTNTALKPERVSAYDIGIDQQLFAGRVAIDATWFRNRYRDLIVGLGGSLSTLSSYSTDNLSNALAKGAEFTLTVRPAAWYSVSGSYTWLETQVLSLDGGSGLVQQYYTLGQPLLRRPRQSGSLLATFHRGRADVIITGAIRGKTLDIEPNFGTSAGFFRNPGYRNFGVSVNYRVYRNLTAYANLRNALNQRYEEIYGYPAPLLNVVAGLKWSFARAR